MLCGIECIWLLQPAEPVVELHKVCANQTTSSSLCSLGHKHNFLQTASHRIASKILQKMSHSDEDGIGIPLFEELPRSTSNNSKAAKKRNFDDDSESNIQKAKKRKRSKKPKDVDDAALDTEIGVNRAIAQMDSRLLADHIAQRTRRFRPELSTMEIEDSYIPGAYS